VPALVAAGTPLDSWIAPAGSRQGDFVARDVAQVFGESAAPVSVTLAPFYRTQRRRYSVYFDLVTPAEFSAHGAAIVAERERVRRLEAATTGSVQPGETQSERDANYQSDPAERPVGRTNGRGSRGGAGWFSVDLAVDPGAPAAVIVTYFNEVGLPALLADFDIFAGGTKIGHYEPNENASGFYQAKYPLASSVAAGKSKLTIRFQAANGSRIVPVCGVRIVRANEL
jgi:hypothetical protein